MFDVDFARDLVFTGAIFGVAAFVWGGWAQERPPKGVIWRIALVVVQLAGAAIAGIAIPTGIRHWDSPTAMVPSNPALLWQSIWTWAEVAAIIVIVIVLVRRKKTEFIAPSVLIIVGAHFFPLTFVFGQPIIMVAAVLITGIGIAVYFLPRKDMAPSFWCGILAGPVFVVLGTIALFTARAALGA